VKILTAGEPVDTADLREQIQRAIDAVGEARASLKGAEDAAECRARDIWTDVSQLAGALRTAGEGLERARRTVRGIEIHDYVTSMGGPKTARTPLKLAPLKARPRGP
jgi:hypothetical protein